MTRLDEFDQAEWWDVARRLHPDMSWEQFEAELAGVRAITQCPCKRPFVGVADE